MYKISNILEGSVLSEHQNNYYISKDGIEVAIIKVCYKSGNELIGFETVLKRFLTNKNKILKDANNSIPL